MAMLTVTIHTKAELALHGSVSMSASKAVQLFLLVWASFAFTKVLAQVQSVPSELVAENGASGRIRGFRDLANKDFAIGGLFSVHLDDDDGNHCKKIQLDDGLGQVEAMLFAIDLINANSELLPNLVLGYDIRDTCFIEYIGLDEAADVALIDTQRECPEIPLPILGLVGAQTSQVSILIASLGRLFQIPQISYGSTSPLLSNQREEQYPYFFRTVIPDNIQAQAIIALVLHFKWNHISIIYSNNAYGTPGRNAIVELARNHDICVNLDKGLNDGASQERYKELADALNTSSADTVVAFALDDSMAGLLEAFSNIHNHRKLRWIASDGWSQAAFVLEKYSEIVLGMFGTAPATTQIPSFQDYVSQLTIDNNCRNRWFPQYYSAVNNCFLNTTHKNTCNDPSSMFDDVGEATSRQLCNESGSISDFQQSFTISRTIEAVYAYAHALQNFLNESCDHPVEWNRDNSSCKGQKRALNGPTMLDYISRVSFTSDLTGRTVEFNDLGYITSRSYEIVNFKLIDGVPQLLGVGLWKANSTATNQSDLGIIQLQRDIQYGIDDTGSVITTLPTVLCKKCVSGQILDPDFSCCGLCSPCRGWQYSNGSNDKACSVCDEFMWGNKPTGEDSVGSTFCIPVEEVRLEFSHPWAVIMIILSLLGLIAVSLVALIFTIYWATPVVRSSGRGQMILLLIGIFLSYMLAFIYVSPPVLAACIIQRIGLWFCFSLMFGALMVKIIVVARVFLQKRSLKLIQCNSPKYQLMFTFLVVAIQMVLVLGSVLYTYPEVSRNLRLNAQNNNDFPNVVVSCNKDHLIFIVLSLVYESAVITVTTILGIISFKYPKNFNEARHITLCTFAVAVIWIAFIPSYFATSSFSEFQNTTISLAVIMSASAILICNFGPRLYIIFFSPGKNSKEQSTIAVTSTLPKQSSLTNPKKLSFLDSLKLFKRSDKGNKEDHQAEATI